MHKSCSQVRAACCPVSFQTFLVQGEASACHVLTRCFYLYCVQTFLLIVSPASIFHFTWMTQTISEEDYCNQFRIATIRHVYSTHGQKSFVIPLQELVLDCCIHEISTQSLSIYCTLYRIELFVVHSNAKCRKTDIALNHPFLCVLFLCVPNSDDGLSGTQASVLVMVMHHA